MNLLSTKIFIRQCCTMLVAGLALLSGGSVFAQSDSPNAKSQVKEKDVDSSAVETITLGGGCFWCVEGAVEILDGVIDVVSGYEGDPNFPNPSYQLICTKRTKHVEVCQVHFDPSRISLEKILNVFFKMHDPTSRNKQGADEGPQYRSVIFYHNEQQKQIAQQVIDKLDQSGRLKSKIVTDIEPTQTFWVAEEYHQDYFRKNPGEGYCRAVVAPKVSKIHRSFPELIKKKE